MTVEDVQKVVAGIREAAADPEKAHSMEDDLCRVVLHHVANGEPGTAELAREALKAGDIEFPRWCA